MPSRPSSRTVDDGSQHLCRLCSGFSRDSSYKADRYRLSVPHLAALSHSFAVLLYSGRNPQLGALFARVSVEVAFVLSTELRRALIPHTMRDLRDAHAVGNQHLLRLEQP